ncbi:MAG: 1-acyl-sn-glycerol-3-phosphate acyltransferase [Oscillospiraceae bacterium]|nr:1-acyl-sn-glycerol-3-phosphate acyltransferase [Oscillospiraceae bacterium]
MFRKSLRAVIKSVLWVVSKLVYRVKIEGKENIKEGEAYILCGNHIHAIDAPVLIINMKRKMPFLAKEELFKLGIVRYLGNLFDMIPVKRGAGDTSSLKKSLKSIKNGEILGIFPEGTRNGLAKNVELKTGAASLALKTNTKILPLGIKGSFKLFSKIVYRFGEPMDFSQYASDKPGKDVLEKITLEVMDRVLELAK